MTDIVERLRDLRGYDSDGLAVMALAREAAAEIERLRAVIAYEASKPDFATLAAAFGKPAASTDE